MVSATAALSAVGDLVAGELLCVDAAGRVAYANPSATRTLAGQLAAAGTGEVTLEALLPPSACHRILGAVADVLANGGRTTLAPTRDAGHPLAGRQCRIAPVPGGVSLTFLPPPTYVPGSPGESTTNGSRELAAEPESAVPGRPVGAPEPGRLTCAEDRERMLAAALATMEQPVLVLTPAGTVCYANEAAVREYGYPREQLSGLPVELLTGRPHAAGEGGAERVAAPARAHGWLSRQGSGHRPAVVATPIVHHRRDGSTFPVSITRAAIRDDDGEMAGEVLCVRNLTDERRVAEQLRQHEKLAALGSLVAGVAHELNNPLTGISAFAQLLLEDALPPEQDESVRLIKREADRAVAVIRDLLLFSRKTEAQLDEVDVNALVQLTVRLRTYTLRTESIGVTLELDPDAPRVVADEQRLQQVLLNLLVNAEYAMHDAVERRLTLRTRREEDELVVEVTDTGAGMDLETQRHIFEPFYTTKPPGVGTGLGLSVSYGIVQAHGGGITVDSAPGCGTTFRITLPARRPPDPSTLP